MQQKGPVHCLCSSCTRHGQAGICFNISVVCDCLLSCLLLPDGLAQVCHQLAVSQIHRSRFRQAFTLDNYKRRLLEPRPRSAPQRLQHNKGMAHATRHAVAANVDKQLEIARCLLYPDRNLSKWLTQGTKALHRISPEMPRLSAQSTRSGAGSLKQSSNSKRHSGYRRLLSSTSSTADHNFVVAERYN